MFSYGTTSTRRRDECHPDCVIIIDEVIKIFNASVLCGKRGEEEQSLAFNTGKSQVEWPYSKHNVDPHNPKCTDHPDKSIAFDLAEFHADIDGYIDWENKQEMWDNAKIILEIAKDLKWQGRITHELRSGCDWDQDGIPVFNDPDETFWDAVHFELMGVE